MGERAGDKYFCPEKDEENNPEQMERDCELTSENKEDIEIICKLAYDDDKPSLDDELKEKGIDNIIEETDENGNRKVRFKPVPAFETPQAIDDLCSAYNMQSQRER